MQFVSISRIFLIFLLYSFIGWCSEVLYVGLFYEHKFINRGFLHGPVCPIYGCGGLVVMILPDKVKSSWTALFFCTMFLCSAVEYITSWEMEKVFKMKWWDYSGHKFNLKGRVCLLNSVLFGFMGLIVVRFVQPFVDRIVYSINDTFTIYLSRTLAAVFIIDIAVTVHKLVDFSTTMAKLKEFGESLRERYAGEAWFRSSSIAEMFASIKEHAAVEKSRFSTGMLQKIESFNAHHPSDEWFVARFPGLSSSSYTESLALIRQRVADRFNEKRSRRAEKKSKNGRI